MEKHYSNFVTYVLLIDNINFYVGSHCNETKEYLTEGRILSYSGNPLRKLPNQEYISRVKLLLVEEYDTKEEAEAREEELIERFYSLLGDRLINQKKGNRNQEMIRESPFIREYSIPGLYRNKGNKYYKEQQEAFYLFEQNVPLLEISQKVGVRLSAINKWYQTWITLKDESEIDPFRIKVNPKNQAKYKRAVELFENGGHSMKSIHEELNVALQTVYRWYSKWEYTKSLK